MQDHQTLHVSTSWDDGVSRTITRSLWPTFYGLLHIEGKFCPAYNFPII